MCQTRRSKAFRNLHGYDFCDFYWCLPVLVTLNFNVIAVSERWNWSCTFSAVLLNSNITVLLQAQRWPCTQSFLWHWDAFILSIIVKNLVLGILSNTVRMLRVLCLCWVHPFMPVSVCLDVAPHLPFWHNDQGLLHATEVTRDGRDDE